MQLLEKKHTSLPKVGLKKKPKVTSAKLLDYCY